MFSRYTVYLAVVIVFVYITKTDAQESTSTGVADPNTAIEQAAQPAAQTPPKRTTKPAGRQRKGRRRGRRRRLRPRTGKAKNVRNGEKAKSPTNKPVKSKPEIKTVVKNTIVEAQPPLEVQPLVKSKPIVDTPKKAAIQVPLKDTTPVKANPPKETAAVNVARKREKSGAPAVQDEFFGLFDETTTVEPEPAGPPPGFDVNAPPRKKIVPVVDTKNSKAYDGTPCNETYKGHETIRTKYMMKYAEGVWETLDCPPNLASGLVWRQDLCACGEELIAQDPNDRCAQMGFNKHLENPHKYMRRHHGADAVRDCAASLVWSQEKCHCMYDPAVKDRPIENKVTFRCKTILQLKFEGNLKNSALGYNIKAVDLRRRGKLPRIRFRKIPGSTDKAAMIVSQPLEFMSYKGNDFQLQVTYSVSFKISPRHNKRPNFMLLLSDECLGNLGGQNKARKPSISLSFQPKSKTFRLSFRTEQIEIDEKVTGAKADKDGWYHVVVYFEDRTVNLENNGQKLFSQTDVLGKIPQNKCPLYIAGRGQGYDRSQDFYGYLDNVNLIKDCKFHEANIKFL